jgi:hypothetical protein
MKRVVEVIDLDLIEVADGEPIRFRVEVSVAQKSGTFHARVLRWESMRLNPSFSDGDSTIADYSVLVEDDSLGVHDISGRSVTDVVEAVLNRIADTLGVKIPMEPPADSNNG